MVEVLDLFRDWTPEMIASIISSDGRGRWERKEFRSEVERRNISEGMKKFLSRLTPEEMEVRVRNSFRSEEAQKKVAEANSERFRSMSKEEIREHCKKGIHSKAARLRARMSQQKYFSSLSNGERREWYRERFSNSEVRSRAAKSLSIYWKEHPEENNLRLLHVRQGNAKRPTEPELFLGMYLEKEFPKEWAYNGDGSQGIIIGGRIPDFINIDGKKEVVEVLGAYWHPESDEREKINHYSKYGFKCIVVWEWDCYLSKELGKLFGV